MFACFSALVGLLLLSSASGFAADATVSVYLREAAGQPQVVVSAMMAEVESLLAPTGRTVDWWSPAAAAAPGTLIVMDLKGGCQPLPDREAAPLDGASALGSTLVIDGRVSPFGQVNCDIVTRYLNHALSVIPGSLRNQHLGRALGRILAHELYHMLGETREHAHEGVAKPEFTVTELMAESFTFESASPATLRASAAMPANDLNQIRLK